MDFESWKKKRRFTICTYLLYGMAFGTDNTLTPVVLIPYLKELVKTNNAQFYYSLSFILCAVVSSIAAIILGRYVDRTRNVKYSIYLALSCGIVGELIFTLHYSPYFPVVARAICGVISAQAYLLRGEIIRCYDEEEGSKVLWWYMTACYTGYFLGSWICVTFATVDFHIGSLQIDRHNFAGVFLSGLFMIIMVLTYLFGHDCSKEYDPKSIVDERKLQGQCERDIVAYSQDIHEDQFANNSLQTSNNIVTPISNGVAGDQTKNAQSPHVSDNGTTNANIHRNNEHIGSPPVKLFHILRGFIRSTDIMFILISTFVFAGVGFTLDMMKPVIVLEIFKWSEKSLFIVGSVKCVGSICILLLISKFCVTSSRIYVGTICCMSSAFLNLISLIIIVFKDLAPNYQIVAIVVFVITYVPVWFLDCSILPNMMGKMVKADTQSFAESARSSLSLLSCIVSGVVIGQGNSVKYWLLGLNGSAFIALMVLVFVRRKNLIDIKLSEFR